MKYESLNRRRIIPENVFKSNEKDAQTISGQVCLSTMSEAMRPQHLVGIPSKETRERPSRMPISNGKLIPKSNNVSVING